MKRQNFLPVAITVALLSIFAGSVPKSDAQQTSADPKDNKATTPVFTEPPTDAWLFWDDFESGDFSRYTGYSRGGKNGPGQFGPAPGIGLGGSQGMRAEFREADGEQYITGGLQVYFGAVPSSGGFKSVAAQDKYLTEVYARFYFKCDESWDFGGADKLCRMTSIQGANYSQSMIAHLWSSGRGRPTGNYLNLDPASGIDITGGNASSLRQSGTPGTNSKLISSKYNDFFPLLEYCIIPKISDISSGKRREFILRYGFNPCDFNTWM
jgi:hypothetical protein